MGEIETLLGSVVTREVVGILLCVIGMVSLLLAGYLVRAEHVSRRVWRPMPSHMGYALAAYFASNGALQVALGLLVMFGHGVLPLWGVVLIGAMAVSAFSLFKIYGDGPHGPEEEC